MIEFQVLTGGERCRAAGSAKQSGDGRFGGAAGVDAFTERRWITVQTAPRPYPF